MAPGAAKAATNILYDFDSATTSDGWCTATDFTSLQNCNSSDSGVTEDISKSGGKSFLWSNIGMTGSVNRSEISIPVEGQGYFSFWFYEENSDTFTEPISIDFRNASSATEISLRNETQNNVWDVYDYNSATSYGGGNYAEGEWTQIVFEWDHESGEARFNVISPTEGVSGITEWTEIDTLPSAGIDRIRVNLHDSDLTSTSTVYAFDDVNIQTAEQGDFSCGPETELCNFNPLDGEILTGPDIEFSLDAYINAEDLSGISGVRITLENIDQNVLLMGNFSPSDILLLEQDVDEAGEFNFSTTTVIGDGNYRVKACLYRSYLAGWFTGAITNPFSGISDCQSHQFIVGTSTFIGSVSQDIYGQTQDFYAGLTGTTSDALAKSCNPLGGSFGIRECIAFMFIPDASDLRDTMDNARESILTRVPWGYGTRFIDILNSEATTTIPAFTAHVTMGPGSGGTTTETITIDPGDMIRGGGELLESIKDPIYGKSARDIFEPFVQLTVALAVLFTIVADVMRSHTHYTEKPGEGNKKLS